RQVAEQTVNAQPASQEFHRDSSPNLVVIHRQPERADPEVAETHHGVGLRANRDVALRLKAVVDDETAALKIERHAFVDVGDPYADAGGTGVEVAPPLCPAADVGFDQPPEHGCEGARLCISEVDSLGRI